MPILISKPEILICEQIKKIKSEIDTLKNDIKSLYPHNHFDRNTLNKWVEYYEDVLEQYDKLLNDNF